MQNTYNLCTEQIRYLVHGRDREGISSLTAALEPGEVPVEPGEVPVEPGEAPVKPVPCTNAQGPQCCSGSKGLVWLQWSLSDSKPDSQVRALYGGLAGSFCPI